MGPEVEKGPLPSGLMFSYNLLIKLVIYLIWSFPGGSDDKESACNAEDLGSVPGSWLPTPVFLPGEFHGQRCRQSTIHGVTKSWTRLSD